MNATKPRHHHGRLKQALIEYALAAAREGTIESMSLRQAARDLGVSSGAVYRHFADKDALLSALASLGFDRLAGEFEAAVPFASAAGSAAEAQARFARLASAYVGFAKSNFGLWRLMFGPYGHAPATSTEDRPGTYAWLGKVLDELSRFGVTGGHTSARQFFVWTSIHGLADLQVSPAVPTSSDPEEVVYRHCRWLETALAGTAEPA